jgi:hypothetical protein
MKSPKFLIDLITTITFLTVSRKWLYFGITIGIISLSFALSFMLSPLWLFFILPVWGFWHSISYWYCETIEKMEKERQTSLKQAKERADPNETILTMSQEEYDILRKEGSVVLDEKYPITLKNIQNYKPPLVN